MNNPALIPCKQKIIVPALMIALAGILLPLNAAPAKTASEQPIRIGYFHGGRTVILMRAYENGEFDAQGLPVELYSKTLRAEGYQLVPKSTTQFTDECGGPLYTGKVRGTELTDAIIDDKMDLAMIGESSFIEAMYSGKPIVAIAELGHDVKKHSGHAILMRKGIKIRSPKDFLGKIIISRRAGPGDSTFLKVFLDKSGVDLKKDVLQLSNGEMPKNLEEKRKLPKNKVLIFDDTYEDVMTAGLQSGVIDGGYFHLMSLEDPLCAPYYLLAPLHDFVNAELSHAVLVCHKDFLRKNRARLVKLIEIYIKRIKYEHSLSYEERTSMVPLGTGFKMAVNIQGLNYPQYDLIPTSSAKLLYEVQRILVKYAGFPKRNIKIEDFIDNSLVLEAAKNLGLTEKDDYRPSEY